MTQHGWSLRWLIGGIYFIIMVVILGGLALFFSYRVEADIVSSDLLMLQKMAGGNNATAIAGKIADYENPDRPIDDRIAAAKDLLRLLSSVYMETQARRVALLSLNGRVLMMRIKKTGADFTYTVPPPGTPVDPKIVEARNTELKGVAAAEIPYTIVPSPSSLFDPEIMKARNGELGWDFRENTETGERFLYIAAPIQIKEGIAGHPSRRWVPRAILFLAVPLANLRQAEVITNVRAVVGVALLASILIVLLVNTLVSSYIARPLAGLSTAAARYADGQLDERVATTGPAEVASLGESFNEMAEQLRITFTKLAEERAQAQAILTSMADALLVTDETGRILLVNHAAEQLCGLTADAVGQTLEETVIHFELHDLLAKTLAIGVPLKHEIIFSRPSECFIEVHMAPVMVEGRTLGVVIVLYDMTHERKLSQMHRDFVANVSHELRTPVTSIRAMAEAMLEAGVDVPEMEREFIATIATESERLTSLLDDLLHLSRIEAGRRLINPEELDVSMVIQYVATRVITPITAKGQQLLLQVPAPLPAVVDRNMLVQILVNLLDNACKYSPEGTTIRVEAHRDGRCLTITVADSGIGISPEEQERVFERFYRVDKARSRAEGGTGLGLAIVRHLVELHGGQISLSSEQGVGSTFTVVLPEAGDEEPSPVDAGERPSGRVLPA